MLRKLLAGVIVLLLFAIVGLAWFLARDKVLDERHSDYQETTFDYAISTFSDYIEYSRQRLLAARSDMPDETVLHNLLPAELYPPADCPRTNEGKALAGIVLVHGLLASPYSMRDFAEFMQSQCYHVLSLLLPDHGSRPGDMLGAHWEDWASATHFATEQLALNAEKIIVSGHSAGGTMALLEATRNSEVDALVLFAPALEITPAAKYARFITPLGFLFKGAAWYEVEADEAIYRYESVTFSAAAETHALIQATLQAENDSVRQLPVFTVASQPDLTVSLDAILDFMQRNRNDNSLTVLYSQHDFATRERMKVIPSSAPEQGILSTSHLGLMTPPTHAHYGRDGTYRNCGHYGNSSNPLFVLCKNGERSWYGAATQENLQQGVVERIAFNPFYDAMLAEVLAFLKKSDLQ